MKSQNEACRVLAITTNATKEDIDVAYHKRYRELNVATNLDKDSRLAAIEQLNDAYRIAVQYAEQQDHHQSAAEPHEPDPQHFPTTPSSSSSKKRTNVWGEDLTASTAEQPEEQWQPKTSSTHEPEVMVSEPDYEDEVAATHQHTVATDVEPMVRSKPRPWRRFFARFIDLYMFGAILGFTIASVAPNLLMTESFELLFGVSLLFVWILIESVLLASFGNTPGKWLLNTRVVTDAGQKLGFDQAFSRSIMVWWRGMGLGLPLISLITQLVAFAKLTAKGTTTWDKDENLIVEHTPLSLFKTLVAISLLVLVFALSVIGDIFYELH